MTDPPSTPLPARLRDTLHYLEGRRWHGVEWEAVDQQYEATIEALILDAADQLEAAHAETTRLTEKLAKARHEEGCERWLRLEAEAETTRLRQERDEWKALNVACKELNATPEKWTMSFDGDAAQHFAKTVAQAFYALNGKNYVEVQLNNANGERFALTFQKVGQFTPDQLKRNAEMRLDLAQQRAAAAEARVQALEQQIQRMQEAAPIWLTPTEQEALLAMLENAPEPNENLRDIFRIARAKAEASPGAPRTAPPEERST